MKLLVKKYNGKLCPCFNSDLDKLNEAKLKEGEIYEIDIKKKRNIKFHKKFFALIELCFNNQENFELQDDLRKYLTCKAGYYRIVKYPNGYEQIEAKSISFANMDDIEFSQLYNSVLDQVCNLLGSAKSDVIEQVVEYY